MSTENQNRFVEGNIIFGKNCNLCSAHGVTCRGGGILNTVPFGQIRVNIDNVGPFDVPGKLDNCAIAAGEVSIETGTAQIKNLAIKKQQEYIDSSVSDAKAEAEAELAGETLELNSTNWS